MAGLGLGSGPQVLYPWVFTLYLRSGSYRSTSTLGLTDRFIFFLNWQYDKTQNTLALRQTPSGYDKTQNTSSLEQTP